jgi:hypothetical protein
MKASELKALLEKTIKIHGDCDVNIHIYDHSDKYDMREYHLAVTDAEAVSRLKATEDSSEICLIAHIR